MVSVPTSHLVLFIASLAVAAGVAGAFTTESSRMSATIEDVGIDVSAEVDTDIEIITDSGDQVYNASSGDLTLHVQNMGESTLPADVDQIDVFLDGTYVNAANLTVTVEDASSWAPDEVVRIDIAAPGLSPADHRVKVVVDGDEDVFEFNRGVCSVTRDVLVFEQDSTNDLAFIDRSGVITDLGVPTGSWDLVGFGPAADFDCDGLLEAPYIQGEVDGGEADWHSLRIVDRNGEVQVLHTWGEQEGTVGIRLGIGDADADGITEVFFPDPDDNYDLYRVEVSESATQIGDGFDSEGVGGLGDFNGDGDLDLVYLDRSNDLAYLEGGAETTGIETADDGNSIGSPLDFDGDGEVRVPIELQSSPQEIVLVDSGGNTQTLNAQTRDAIGSLATFDWDDDGTADIVWVDNDDADRLYVTELDGTTTRLTDDSGNPVEATNLGVA